MPLYEYRCPQCGYTFEQLERISTQTSHDCPVCGDKAKMVLGAPSLRFTGTGFYETDYKGKE